MSEPCRSPARDPGPPTRSRGDPAQPTRDELLEGLNEPQRAAVVHEGAPLLVVAGAGSGKTRVLTRRIAWLISERKAHPGSILAITFTNKAAAEMKERVEELVGRRARIMWVSTFHSACVRILRKEIDKLGFKSNFSIYDAADSKRLMTLVCSDLDLDPKRFQPGAVLHWVSNQKNELRDPEEAAKDASNNFEETYAAAYTLYQRRLREANALDFDDLIMTTVHLFQTFPEVRETYRRRFRHVLVDEYQDTNHAQYALIHAALRRPDRRSRDRRRRPAERVEPAELMVVGDADQSIYAFRGANIRNILDFEQDFPNATSILLEQNYRSTQTILNAANAVIGHNKGRKAKRLWSDAGDGERIVGYVADDEHDEARFVSEEIDTLTDERRHGPATWRSSTAPTPSRRVFEEVFIRTGQPYKVVGGVRFYERARGARRARLPADAGQPRRPGLAAPDPQHPQARHRRPGRGLRQRARRARADHVLGGAAPRRRGARPRHPVADADPGLRRDGRGAAVDGRRRASAPTWSSSRCSTRSGYLDELEASDDPQDETRVENLAELVAVAREFSDDPVAGPSADPADVDAGIVAPGLGDFLERVALVADTDQIPDEPDERRLGRGHADDAAHRQGPGVPGRLPDRPRGRRLPALALARRPARARGGAPAGLRRRHPRPQRLYVSRAVVRSAWGAPSHNPASRFLDELPVDLVDWRRTEAAQTQWGRPDLAGRQPAAAGHADRGRAPQLLRRRRPRRRRRQGQAGPRDPVARARRPGAARLVRPGHRRRARGRRPTSRRLDRLRLRGRQAAAAALRAGREALTAGVELLRLAHGR